MAVQHEKKINEMELEVPVLKHSTITASFWRLKCFKSIPICLASCLSAIMWLFRYYSKLIVVIGLLSGIGGIFLVGGSYVLLHFDWFLQVIINRELILKENCVFFERWKIPPIPFIASFYLFNITNVHEFPWQTSKPQLTQLGPYVFREYWNRTNFKWHDNGTASYSKIRSFIYDETMSTGSLDDMVINVNVPLLGAADKLRTMHSFVKMVASPFLKSTKEPVLVKKSAKELLYGYTSPMVKLAKTFSPKIPFDQFGYLYGRNMTATERYTLYTGVDGKVEKMGLIERFNEKTNLGIWGNEQCNKVIGTDGTSFPPSLDKTDLQFFHSYFCRSFNLSYINETNYFGVNVYQYVLDKKVFASGNEDNYTQCFCKPGICLKSGVVNIAPCLYELPLYMSQPHFYQGDESYIKTIDGLKPNSQLHSSYIWVEPLTGVPMRASAKIQLNVYLEPVSGIEMFSNMPTMMLPIMWFEESNEVIGELLDEFKSITYTLRLCLNLACYISLCMGLSSFACILFIIYKNSHKYEYKEYFKLSSPSFK